MASAKNPNNITESSPTKNVTAAIIIIGNEILSGRTKEANSHYLAQKLTEKGIRLTEIRMIEDDEAMIIATINAMRRRYDYVFTSGGIGPTHDDITALAVARAFGVELRRDPRAIEILAAHYPPGGLTEARLKMTEIPMGAGLIANPVSKAPGFSLENLHVMAGVPDIFRAMVDELLPSLAGGAVIISETIRCAIGESFIAHELGHLQKIYPDVAMGSYPFYRNAAEGGGFGTSLVLRSVDATRLDEARAKLAAILTERKIPFEIEPRS